MWHAWERGQCVQSFGGKLKGKRPLERPRYKWDDGLRMNLWDIGLGGGGWSGFTWLNRDHWRAVVNEMMNLQVLVPQS
jgi:hypothetical protein